MLQLDVEEMEDEAKDAEEDLGEGIKDKQGLRKPSVPFCNKYDEIKKPLHHFSNEWELLDQLEGVAREALDNDHDFNEFLPGVVDNNNDEAKVVHALKGKSPMWAAMGAGKMIRNIITRGLRLNFNKPIGPRYRENNNKSFTKDMEVGNAEVLKLLARESIEEEPELHSVNPLSLASNRKGKKRLCLDLSRNLNEVIGVKVYKRLLKRS